MSAALSPSPAQAASRSEGVWAAGWRRFRQDRVGLVCLAVVLAFLLLIAASLLGLVAA
ncbi:ABC transporter permease, partial [Escherichia coli]|nr:ABC transporter permease [Escherichia coli]